MNLTVNGIGQQMAAMDSRQGQKPAPQTNSSPATDSVTIPLQKTEFQQAQKAVKQLQDISDILGRKIHFNVDTELDKVIVKIIDPVTDKVIKEIPSAEIQKLQLHIRETLGLLIDEKI